ncbi:MAG: nucleoside phosphorylase [Candidatus Hydrogenedentes bacterium]|nr:nucleoside phosphorylase [Candidatus Hydrogenedentota bacterium]
MKSGQHDTGSQPLRAPLLENKDYESPSVFSPHKLLDNARRQRQLAEEPVPSVCVLDPDGDIVRHLTRRGMAQRVHSWACYHTELHRFLLDGAPIGVIPCAVGGAFAVLVAEQLFTSGCEILVSITSAGRILPVRRPPYFVLIEKALRDEGTSYHYLPPSTYVEIDPALSAFTGDVVRRASTPIERGAAWTTDAPFRETEAAVAFAEAEGILAVEMEAASLYAFAQARQKPVLCFALVTNQPSETGNDFEKGEGDGSIASLELLRVAAYCWRERGNPGGGNFEGRSR